MTTDFSEHNPKQTRRVVRFTEPMLLTRSSPRADWRDAKLRGKTLFVVRHFVTLMAGTARACSAVFETCRRKRENKTPPVFSLPSGRKIYYGRSRYYPKWCSGSLRRIFLWPSENRKSWASDQGKARKAPRALSPALVLPPFGVLNIFWRLKIQVLACVATGSQSLSYD